MGIHRSIFAERLRSSCLSTDLIQSLFNEARFVNIGTHSGCLRIYFNGVTVRISVPSITAVYGPYRSTWVFSFFDEIHVCCLH